VRRPRGKISRAPVPVSGWPAESIGSRGVLPDGWNLVLAEIAAPAALRPPRLSWLAQPGAPGTGRRGHAGTARAGCDGSSWQVSRAGSVRTFHGPATDLRLTWHPPGGPAPMLARGQIFSSPAHPRRGSLMSPDGSQGGSSGVIRQAPSLPPTERRAGSTSGITQTAGGTSQIQRLVMATAAPAEAGPGRSARLVRARALQTDVPSNRPEAAPEGASSGGPGWGFMSAVRVAAYVDAAYHW
jgi:hypothetical protein